MCPSTSLWITSGAREPQRAVAGRVMRTKTLMRTKALAAAVSTARSLLLRTKALAATVPSPIRKTVSRLRMQAPQTALGSSNSWRGRPRKDPGIWRTTLKETTSDYRCPTSALFLSARAALGCGQARESTLRTVDAVQSAEPHASCFSGAGGGRRTVVPRHNMGGGGGQESSSQNDVEGGLLSHTRCCLLIDTRGQTRQTMRD